MAVFVSLKDMSLLLLYLHPDGRLSHTAVLLLSIAQQTPLQAIPQSHLRRE